MAAPPGPDGVVITNRIQSDARAAFLFQMAALATGAITNIIIARTLGPHGKGILSLLGYAIFVATSLGGLGAQPAAIHLIGKGHFSMRQVAAAVAFLTLAAGVLCGAATLVLLPRLRGTVPLTQAMIGLTALLVLPSLLRLNLGGLLLAVGRIRTFNIIQAVPSFLWTAGTFICLVLLRGDVRAAIYLWTALYGLSGILSAVWILALVPPRLRGAGPALSACLGFGMPAYLANLAWMLVLRVDGFILAAYRSAAEVGIYSVAVLLAEIILYIPRSMTLAINRRLAAGEKAEAARLAARAARNGAALSVLAVLPLVGASWLAIPLVFGPAFASSLRPLVWLQPGIVAMSVVSPLTVYLVQQRGKPAWTGGAALAGLLVDLALCFLWIPDHGAVGAARASSVAYAAHAGVILVLFRRETGCPWRDLLLPDGRDVREWARLAAGAIPRRSRGHDRIR